jgi:hypothetical protein
MYVIEVTMKLDFIPIQLYMQMSKLNLFSLNARSLFLVGTV